MIFFTFSNRYIIIDELSEKSKAFKLRIYAPFSLGNFTLVFQKHLKPVINDKIHLNMWVCVLRIHKGSLVVKKLVLNASIKAI